MQGLKSGVPFHAVQGLEILDRGGTAQIEQVLAGADVAGTVPFAGGDVSQRVLDGDASAEVAAAGRGALQFAELLLQGLVLGDRHTAALAGRRLGATRAETTGAARLGIEVHG